MKDQEFAKLVTKLYADRDRLGSSQLEPEWFWGPDSLYCRFVSQLSAYGKESLTQYCPHGQQLLTVEELCELSGNERLSQLARLRLADKYLADLLIDSLIEPPIGLTQNSLASYNYQENWFRKSCEFLDQKIGSQVVRWSLGYWRALGFVSDFLNGTGQPIQGSFVERAPILIANDSVGRVLWLVAERMPGPAIVTPHWWKLGLVHLGDGQSPDLLVQVQSTLSSVLRSQKESWQVRWWLETYPNGGDWHEEIDTAPSIQAAAGCLVLALADDHATRPVLDSRAVVSAQLDEHEHLLDVGHVERKIDACKRAGLQCLVLSPGMVEKHKAYAEKHAPELQLLPSTKLTDTYEILQATSPQLQAAKQCHVKRRNTEFQETKTEPRFIDASEKKR